MKTQTLEYFVHEVSTSLIRNRWMTFVSIGTVTVSLFVLGVFLLIVLNMTRMASEVESQVQITAYLNDAVTKEGRVEIEKMLHEMKSISKIEYVTRDEALKRLKERLGDQKYILDALGDTNPLPNFYEVTVTKPEQVQPTAAAIADLYGVDEARYGQDVAANLFEATRLVRMFAFLLLVLLTGATIFIISNTIRLTVFARRREIAIMKYVGATDWFIRIPFILEGMTLGFIGGLLSALAIRSFYAAMTAKIYDTLAFLPLIPQYPFINYFTIALIISGMAIGIVGSTVSLKRFLQV
ncbi:MAG: permease-like cell division protein FtsX [Selenomonadaceae bacterium]|nr:permease-like cell division protein FtsX [Selenomonadaceae bacterium]MBR1859110.1 permease-like cell division protein FtsX [Selenomonadaceae bacterium]